MMDREAWHPAVHGVAKSWTWLSNWTVVCEIHQARILEWEAFPTSPGDLPNPGIEPRSPTLQVDSLPAEPQGKPKNIGVVSLSLLQEIFLTQELNWGLLHCRWILYQLNYQRSPYVSYITYVIICKYKNMCCTLVAFSWLYVHTKWSVDFL